MMRIIGTVVVALLALYIIDTEFADGRYFLALKTITRHLAGRVGFYY
jgi:hypothetical protein